MPTSSDHACITKAGIYRVTLEGSESAYELTLGGTSGHQTLDVLGVPNIDTTLTLSASTGNKISAHGILELDAETGGGHAELAGGPAVTVSNSGEIETAGALTNTDYIDTNLINSAGATVKIAGASTSQGDNTSTTNNGTFNVASNGYMQFSGFDFTQSGGSETGNPVVLYQYGTLVDSAGTGSFDVEGTGGLAGTVPAGQTVTVLGVTNIDSTLSLAGNVTNDGTVALDAQSNGGHAELYYGGNSANTLTNNGTFETLGATSNTDYLNASLANSTGGTVNIAGASTAQGDNTSTTNNGTFNVADGGSMYFDGGSGYTQSSKGTFSATVDANTGVSGISGGTGTVAGTLAVTTVGSPAAGNSYNVINSASSVGGTFSACNFGSTPYTVSYSPTAVTLTVPTASPNAEEHHPHT